MHQINVLPLLEKLGIDFDKEKFIALRAESMQLQPQM